MPPKKIRSSAIGDEVKRLGTSDNGQSGYDAEAQIYDGK